MFRRLPITLAAVAALVACESETDGRGNASLSVQSSKNSKAAAVSTNVMPLTAISGISVTGTNGTSLGTIELTEAWLVVEEIELEHEDDTDVAGDGEVEFVGPFAIDLLAGTSYPALPTVETDAGTYTDIELSLRPLVDADIAGMTDLPSGMVDSLKAGSVYLSGSYTTGSSAAAFTVSFDVTEELELTGTGTSNGFEVSESGTTDLIIDYRLNEWFRFDNSETNEDGVSFTGTFSAAVNAVILENIKESAEYGEDADGDGQLGEDEDDD